MSKSLSAHPYAGKKRFQNAEVAPADHAAGQVRKAAWTTGSRSQPILSGRKLQPGEGALTDPAPAAQPRAVLRAAAGDDRLDAARPQGAFQSVVATPDREVLR